jgi:hypothetical protein
MFAEDPAYDDAFIEEIEGNSSVFDEYKLI